MSSGNNTDGGNNGNGADKVNWQHIALPDLIEQVEDLLEWAAEQEAQRKAKEERKKAKEEAKRVAKEEAKRLAEEEAKKKAEEDTQKRAKFQARWQADMERKVREKAEAKAASEVMKAHIAQKAAQGEKPKPKVHATLGSQPMRAQRGGPGVVPPVRPMLEEQQQQVKCYFEVLMATMKRLASGEKHKESKTSVTMVTMSPQGGKKRKRMRKVVANAASTEEIEEALGGFSVAGPSMQPDPVMQVLDWQLGEVIVAIDHNMRELACLGGKMDGFVWEMKRMADQSDQKGKGKARPEETEEEEEKSDNGEDKEEVDNVSDVDAEGEDAEE
ncbi:hypothetical protein SCLCIDRAFT_24927 [Scleroderma citrinum Foug A]|uniref:Uncharacterized protein n=1 Tax=Scleroderma citrinum Foug A TaxID=1036808 RepID=A0A0C3DPT5_9AGAM|nr:hypothetical protein SCLCIDRAFT_24927 [Scleroderma citrinum Foug A]